MIWFLLIYLFAGINSILSFSRGNIDAGLGWLCVMVLSVGRI